jgi:hypothetical protein
MPGLSPGIHIFFGAQDVDGRDNYRGDALLPGHDVESAAQNTALSWGRDHFLVLPESFTASKVANSTLYNSPSTFSTLRM